MDVAQDTKTCAERRREARRMKDPHHQNPFRRFYLGPSPVSASAAANVAQAIAEDVKVEKPRAIGVAGRDGRVVSGKPSQEFLAARNASQATRDGASNAPSLHRARSSEGVEVDGRRGGRSFSPMTNRMLSPLKIPDSNRSFPAFRRRMSREASFTSAKSMPDSVLSEGDLPMNQSTSSAKPKGMTTIFRSNTNAAVIDLADQDLPLTPVKRLSRRESQSSYEPSRELGRKKLSFEVLSPRERRGRSEGAPHIASTPAATMPGASILQKEPHLSTPTRSNHDKLLDVPSTYDSAGPSQQGTPTRSTPLHARYPLRNQASHRSLAAASRSSMVIHAVDEDESTGGEPQMPMSSSPVKQTAATESSNAPISSPGAADPDTSVNFDTSRAAALKSLKAKASEKYSQARIGQDKTLPRSAALQSHLAHSRDVSRQSRMSRASTAGTFGSVGTRFSEGSFGATGGFRSKLAMKLGRKTSRLMEESARKVKLEKQRHSRGSSSLHGVVPGAVGTSAGGTKWVGQTFEVGKRFWQVTETREEELRDSRIEEEDEGSSPMDEERKIRAMERRQDASRESQIQSPDEVLESFARQAQVGSDEHQDDDAKSRRDKKTRARSAESLRDKRREKIHQANLELKAGAVDEDGKQKKDHPEKKVSESKPSPAEIENRRGWNDVVSFMSRAKETKRKSIRPVKSEAALTKGSQLRNETASTVGEAMSVHTALETPEVPLGVEDRFPQITYELLRRNSNPGTRPGGELDDAASDHEVAAKPVSQSPGLLTPLEAHSSDLRSDSNDQRTRTISSNSWDERGRGSSPPTSSTPFLRKMASTGDLLTSRTEESAGQAMASILNDGSVGLDPHIKKTVQFQGGTSPTPPMSRLGTALFPSRSGASKPTDGKMLVGGRVRSVTQGDAAPAPPEEVLSRNASLDGTATPGAHSPYGTKGGDSGEGMITRRSILRRDRMLVRLAWTPSEDLPKLFGERESRQYTIYGDSFKEYMVVYRTGRLELWEDPSLVSKVLGHGDQLKLHVAANLRRGRAFVSMYSYIDGIFCLTFTKDDDSHHRLLPLRRSGTCIWIFDARTMSVAADWMWDLWRELDGQLPAHIDVHFSALSVRVRIPVPEEVTALDSVSEFGSTPSYLEGGEGFKMLSRGYVKKIVRKVVETQPEWRQLCQSTEISGLQFELAWRSGSTLDWVREDLAANGQRRDWSVLVGSILSSAKKPASLEYRPAHHYPTSVRTAKGETMLEPAGVEGFLWRVKAVSGALTRIYVTTHDGLIFVNRSSKSFPPDRHLATLVDETAFGISGMSRFAASAANDQIEQERRRKRDAIRGRKRAQAKDESLSELRSQVLSTLTALVSTEEEIDAQIDAYRAFEKRRQFEQISNTDGYVDVRDIVLIRSLAPNGVSHQPSADGSQSTKSTEHLNGDAAHPSTTVNGHHADSSDKQQGDTTATEVEEEDLGGEEGLALAKDRIAMKTARQFEVTLSNGRSIRFEAYSKSVAEEWVTRIASISQYWKRREKVDALEIMLGSGMDPAMIGRYVHGRRNTSATRDLLQAKDGQELSMVLGGIWNWCVYDSCRGILKSGRLFQKKKAFSGFYSRYYILIAGRLLHFKLMTSNSTARARQNSGIFHKRQETVVHLRDAYVYSGQLTEDMLVNGRSEGAGAITTYGGGSGGAAASSASRHILPRVYGDGLLSVDDDEDCTFIIRYRPQRVNVAADPAVEVNKLQQQQPSSGDAATSVAEQTSSTTRPAAVNSAPKLNDTTYNHLVLRARCKLERDLWVRAISVECERLSREDREREEKIRNQGQTPWKVNHNHTSFT